MHRTAITETRLLNWLTAGRGQGVGETYQPWLQVTRQDHASLGQSHLLIDPFIGRQHHLLSNLERATCVIGMSHPFVTDIREQYPLWPHPHANPLVEVLTHLGCAVPTQLLEESEGTLAIAKAQTLRHAHFVGLSIPYVYTTDQLLTVQFPGRPPFLVAIANKYWSDLRGSKAPRRPANAKHAKARRKRFLKLRLERAYWSRLGIPWMLVTDRDIHPQAYRNLEWALSGAIQRVRDEDIGLLKRFLWAWHCATTAHGRCIDQMNAIAAVLQINTETTIRLYKLALMRALLPVDLSRPVHLQLPTPRYTGHSTMAIPEWSFMKALRRGS